MANYGLGDFQLHIIQGTQSDSLLMLEQQLTALNLNRENQNQRLIELSAENAQLGRLLNEYQRFEALSEEIRPEMSSLFPQIARFTLTRVTEFSRDTTATASYVAAVIQNESGRSLSEDDTRRLHDWLQARVKADSLVIVRRD
jgi:hypothetical protein